MLLGLRHINKSSEKYFPGKNIIFSNVQILIMHIVLDFEYESFRFVTGKNILKHAKIIGHSQSYANSALLIEAAWRDVGQMIAKL